MELIGKEKLDDFKRRHPNAQSQLDAWEAEVRSATWKTPHDVQQRYQKVSLPGKQQAIFNFCGNQYRLLAKIAYKLGIVLVKEIGTHKEYDKWDIE
ncbi:MAG TPA: type II toxin-antitoxin system HigB family toxin [Candidatus Paceibacterota bacterium]|nr:type II toxin-antitoxin system HigB family toxin [Candidatus Paceibacterota bacterium]